MFHIKSLCLFDNQFRAILFVHENIYVGNKQQLLVIYLSQLGIGDGQSMVVTVGGGGVGLTDGIEIAVDGMGRLVKVSVDTTKEVPG